MIFSEAHKDFSSRFLSRAREFFNKFSVPFFVENFSENSLRIKEDEIVGKTSGQQTFDSKLQNYKKTGKTTLKEPMSFFPFLLFLDFF